jgi:protein-S-isoprenylcysteine O-methyltransferase Ste14
MRVFGERQFDKVAIRARGDGLIRREYTDVAPPLGLYRPRLSGTIGHMRKGAAAAGSAAFFIVAPGTVAGLAPWGLTQWQSGAAFEHWLPARLLGLAMLLAGATVLIHAFARFVVEGFGTPAPLAPPEHLVVGGLYRYVRNPMYVAVIAAILGQALLLWRPALLAYAAIITVAMVSFVLGYEQPTLARQFGSEYAAYRRAVPGWWPRLTPWHPPPDEQRP